MSIEHKPCPWCEKEDAILCRIYDKMIIERRKKKKQKKEKKNEKA